jgi:hypothetical protein
MRVFYVVCQYADPVTGLHTSATDVMVYGKLDASKMVEVMDVCAEKFGVERAKMVITFFAELEA